MRELVNAANARLKEAKIHVSIRLHGNSLYLRVNCLAKPNDGVGRKRYELRPGGQRIPASKYGVRQMEIEAFTLAKRLIDGSFDWQDYELPKQDLQQIAIAQLVEKFKTEYLKTHKCQESTWVNSWQGTFNKLPPGTPLSEGVILARVFSTDPNSRSREVTCQHLQHLANYAGLAIDLKPYHGDYEAGPRDIPSDELIEEWRDRIPNRDWQWVYGLIATFGLRPHEVFFSSFLDPLTLKVKNGKTKARTARAIHPHWAKKWNLIEVNCPKIAGRNFREYGQRVSRAFGSDRYNLPFHAYDLRHAWAIRSSVSYGVPVSTSAAMMGHSVTTHTQVYHRWLSDAQNEAVYKRIVLGDR